MGDNTEPGSRAAAIEHGREIDRLDKLNAPLLETQPARAAMLRAMVSAAPGISADAQADRVLKALRTGPITSQEVRNHLDVNHPAGRVLTLRQRDFDIALDWVKQLSTCGKLHRIGRYTLNQAMGQRG